MTRPTSNRVSLRCILAAYVAALVFSALCGCSAINLRGESAEVTELSALARQARPVDPNLEPFSFSNKARDIEADLGVGQTSYPKKQF
ncbi:MAG: hypothetical protein ACUVQG_08620 [Thermogutta sp.]